jgi:ABC-2 type transport system permease protein
VSTTLDAMLTVAGLELRRMLGGPRPFVLAALTLVVAVLGFVVRKFAPLDGPGAGVPEAWGWLYVLLLTFLFLQTIGILVPLLHASGLIRDELEEGTLVYLFTRPLPKPLLFLSKFGAASALSAVIVGGGMVAFHVAFSLAGA